MLLFILILTMFKLVGMIKTFGLLLLTTTLAVLMRLRLWRVSQYRRLHPISSIAPLMTLLTTQCLCQANCHRTANLKLVNHYPMYTLGTVHLYRSCPPASRTSAPAYTTEGGRQMGERGFPTTYRCGTRASRRTSKTTTNPGRLFHTCPYRDKNNPYHLFKWTDEAMVEEIEDMKERLDDFERASLTTEKGLQVCESEIQTLTTQTRTCCNVVSGFEKELRGFEKDIKDVKMELKSLKNM
ncbi:hypothetical protein Bca52824_017831 [Brassica carinata]|uniref:GRF-type domain-containing protein n=1 Tax=Brassica carinata TaxID=52824 RepID=A0A8X8AVS9_BRACI|nr:hypothetical protein Bca52824_017831 [Brassica carinata]